MNHYGLILRKLREISRLPIKEAAKKIERSAGWLSQIENGKGAARIHPQEFERIVAAYGGVILPRNREQSKSSLDVFHELIKYWNPLKSTQTQIAPRPNRF